MRTVILHHHLFKNAGTSLDQILKGNFGPAWVTREFSASPSRHGNTPEVESWIRDNPEAVAFSSHTMMGPPPQVEGVRIVSMVLLRDPIDRIKSAYRFERTQVAETFGAVLAKHTDLEGYVKVRLSLKQDRQCRNFQTYRLAALVPGKGSELERAKQALERITIVGLVADFSGAVARLTAEISDTFPNFRWEEVHSNRSDATSATQEQSDLNELLKQYNADDLALIAHCVQATASSAELHLSKKDTIQ